MFGELECPLDVDFGGLRVAEPVASGGVEQQCLHEKQRQRVSRFGQDRGERVGCRPSISVGKVCVGERGVSHVRVPFLLGQPGERRPGRGRITQLALRLRQQATRRTCH
jgi:hypothetical protein